MRKIRYRYVYNRKKHTNEMGEALVQIEARLDGRKAYFSTNIYVKPTEWEHCMVVGRHDATALNGMLLEMMVQLQKVEIAVWRCGAQPTLQHLRKGWRTQAPSIQLLRFAEETIATSDRRESTKQCLLSTVRLLHAFRPITLLELTYGLLREFEQYLRQRGDCQNTIVKHMHNLRTIAGEAVRMGLMTQDQTPFSTYRIKAQHTEHTTLTQAELRRIAHVDVHVNVRDAFLFCCHTGLRYSDYVRLESEHFVKRGQTEWLQLCMQKTRRTVRLPLTQLSSLLGEIGPHPHIADNADTNQKLKIIAQHAQIKKRITFHTARHTFATLLLAKGVPITTVQTLLGHTSILTTQRYTEVREHTLIKDLQRSATKKAPQKEGEKGAFAPQHDRH